MGSKVIMLKVLLFRGATVISTCHSDSFGFDKPLKIYPSFLRNIKSEVGSGNGFLLKEIGPSLLPLNNFFPEFTD